MPLTTLEFQTLEGLIRGDSRAEVACGDYLHAADLLLLPATPHSIQEMPRERRSPYGSSDYIVIADMREGTGSVQRFAYFWELKAPQSPLMERDDAISRYRPSKDLVKAETQLIHYWSEAKGSTDFKERYNIRYSENIKMGGIIIGRDGRLLSGVARAAEEQEAEHSFLKRQAVFYSTIRILTWDRVLESVRPLVP